MIEPKMTYPGDAASKWEILDLAHDYYNCAVHLFSYAQNFSGNGMEGPARLCAIHAIELYLNAFLRHEGLSPKEIRKRQHNLSAPDFATKLQLRAKTVAHLSDLTARREYLVARYAPDSFADQSQVNRLLATLKEVMFKASAHISSENGLINSDKPGSNPV